MILNTGIIYITNQFSNTLNFGRSLIWNLIIKPMKIFLLQKVSQVKSRNDYIFWHAQNLRIVLLKKSYFVWEINEWIYKWYWNRKCFLTKPLNSHKTVSNETLSFLNIILNVIAEKNVTIAHGLQKKTVSILLEEFVKSKHFHIVFLRVNLAIMPLEIFQ